MAEGKEGRFSKQERVAVRTAEVYRNEAQRLYNYAARCLKGFSIGIYNRFMEFVAQDENIILALKGILVEMENDVVIDSEKNLVSVNIIPIVGLGEKPGENESEPFGKLTENFCKSLKDHENAVMKTYSGMQQSLSSNFLSFFNERLSLQGLLEISNTRLHVLDDLARRRFDLFTGRNADFSWRCSYCGFIARDFQAPDECPCCRQPKSWFEAGDWQIMRKDARQ